MMSRIVNRMLRTEQAYIEDILDKYSNIPDLTSIALGSSSWRPPETALEKLKKVIDSPDISNYGSIMGLNDLREKIKIKLNQNGVNTSDMDVMITCGANQAFMNTVLATCDEGDSAVILAPYYFSHKLALQLAGAKISICPFSQTTLKPDISQLRKLFDQTKPSLLVVTSPNNPSGLVFDDSALTELCLLCRENNSWLVIDETYHEFLHENTLHTLPCAKRLEYENIIHISSFSKSFGMAGWRVGYLAYPNKLNTDLRKIQDTIPTHTSNLSQQLALFCLEADEEKSQKDGQSFVSEKVASLNKVRERLWSIVEPYGTIKSFGAFYFLVPIPPKYSEEEVVDILARKFKVLVMPGGPFGAPGYLRISYGKIVDISVLDKLEAGFKYLYNTSSGSRI